ncbi:MAG: hypothetical protein M3Y90_01725 [Actinomycetota bacterium]|nr:hypothetical protein [Actinomycetota bacterium]
MPVPMEQKVAALTRDVGPQRLAELLGVDPPQVARWQRGEKMGEVAAERVDLLELVMAHLLRHYPIETAERWLFGVNRSLGDRRPVDLIHGRETRDVLDAITNGESLHLMLEP